MDKRLVSSVGRGRIESCDLFTRDHQFIHVKRYSGSNALSHLFNQGVVSGELFLSDRSFRLGFNELLPPSHQRPDPARAVIPSEFEIAYGIITPRGRALSLPFFSKLSLRNASRLLLQFGYRVTVTEIPTP
jgi:uncharacterized protein (TIGR04141 family)